MAVTRGHFCWADAFRCVDFSVLYFGRFSSVGVLGSSFQETTRRGPQTLRSGATSCLGEAVVSQEGCPSISRRPVHWERSSWQHQSQLAVVPEPAKNWMRPAS